MQELSCPVSIQVFRRHVQKQAVVVIILFQSKQSHRETASTDSLHVNGNFPNRQQNMNAPTAESSLLQVAPVTVVHVTT